MESMVLLYDIYEIQKSRREALLEGQQRRQPIGQASGTPHISHRWAQWLIGIGMALQRYGHTLEQHAAAPANGWAATSQELHLSR